MKLQRQQQSKKRLEIFEGKSTQITTRLQL